MDEVREKKQEIRNGISTFFNSLASDVLEANTRVIENRLFEFANFLESKIVMLYVNSENEVATDTIIKRAYDFNKIVVLPAFDPAKFKMKLMKVDNPKKDLISGPRGIHVFPNSYNFCASCTSKSCRDRIRNLLHEGL